MQGNFNVRCEVNHRLWLSERHLRVLKDVHELPKTFMSFERRPWASKDIHELGSSRWHHNLMDRDTDVDLPPPSPTITPSSAKILPYSLLTMMTKFVVFCDFHITGGSNISHIFVLFDYLHPSPISWGEKNVFIRYFVHYSYSIFLSKRHHITPPSIPLLKYLVLTYYAKAFFALCNKINCTSIETTSFEACCPRDWPIWEVNCRVKAICYDIFLKYKSQIYITYHYNKLK